MPETRTTCFLVTLTEDTYSDVEGDVLIDWWVRRLERVEDGYVGIDSSSRDVINKLYVSSFIMHYILSDRLEHLVLGTFSLRFLHPELAFFATSPSQSPTSCPHKTLRKDTSLTATLSGLVTLHLRRGDYETWSSEFMGLNQFSELLDQFDLYPYLYCSLSSSIISSTCELHLLTAFSLAPK